MKLILIVGLLALAGCAGGKHAVGQANDCAMISDNEVRKCKELFGKVAPFMLETVKEAIKMPVNGVTHDFDNDTYYDSVCHETIVCDNVEYCISFIKPDGTVISSFATEDNAH
jgi:hypothetical protein